MKASCNWLRELSGVAASADEIAARLTGAGLEIEGIHRIGAGLESVVIAEVRSQRAHPKRDKVTLVTVFDGAGELEIVCGASNVPAAGGRVLLAKLGAKLPNGMEIAARDVGGVTSQGMLCSEVELAIGDDGDGIVVLDDESPGKPGDLAADVLQLRDEILEVNVTPNRPDALGHVGIARELALLSEKTWRRNLASVPPRILADAPSLPKGTKGLALLDGARAPTETLSMMANAAGVPDLVPITIEDGARCPRYLGLVLQHVKVRRSPLWLRHRLFSLGQRSIDAVVDATNWVLLETGHPIHAFDVAKLAGPRIVVRTAKEGEKATTLDGVERTLVADDLVIADAERPVALAGVMGCAGSGVSASTTTVLLEVAYFDPRSVRRTSRRHGIHSEASHRFERGADPHALDWVLRRAATLLAELAGAAPAPLAVDAEVRFVAPASIDLTPGYVSEMGGSPIAESEIRRVLEGVGCSIAPGEASGWRVTAPTWRPDLTRPIDLVEEVLRVRGYAQIPERLMSVSPESASDRRRARTLRAIRSAAVAAGLSECVSFSFLSRRELEMARATGEIVALANPLSEERSVMRTSLLPGLLNALARSERRGEPRARTFELGRIYTRVPRASKDDVPTREWMVLGMLLSGARGPMDDTPLDFHDGKGALESVARSLHLEVRCVRGDLPARLHPARSALVELADGTHLGVIGEVHPDVLDAFGVTTRPVVVELDAELLVARAEAASVAQVAPLPRYPAVHRDVAVVVAESAMADDVGTALRAAAKGLAERVELFDVYRGKPIPDGKKSLAFRVAYRDPEATLTDERVQKAHAELVAAAGKLFGAELRS